MSTPEGAAETSGAVSLEDELTQAFGTDDGSSASAAQSPSSGAPVSGEQSSAGHEAPPEAPKHWSEADRALFAKAPPDIQRRWIAREAEAQKGVDAKFQEIAGFRREREELDELFAPFARDLELNGINRTSFLKSLIGGHKYLLEKPREALLWIAQQYGVDPKTLLATEGADPKTAEIDNRFSKLERTITGFMTEAQQAAHAEKLGRVQNFAEAKGEDGKPAHPYFDEVSEDILALLKANPALGLDTAYTKALRMNDEVWQKVQNEKALGDQGRRDAERKAAVDKAKRAATGSEGAGANGTTKPKTLAEELEAGFASWTG